MKLPPSPTYDPKAFRLLSERTEYETWLLEAVYSLVEQDLFPIYPDEVIYPVDSVRPVFLAYARASITIGDWRSGFLNAGAPLVFISTFKLLDMFIEWVLQVNGFPSTFRFQEKIKQLNNIPPPTFPELIETRPWLKDRLISLYSILEPLRGTIVHDKHFTTTDGAICVARSKGKVAGPQIEISCAELRKLALTVMSVLRYVGGMWFLDPYREKVLRHNMDELTNFHGLPSLEQMQPVYPTVRVYSTEINPLHVNLTAIRSDLAEHYLHNDFMYNLRVLSVKKGTVVRTFLFPWSILENDVPGGGGDINLDAYRIPNPNDIDPAYCKSNNTNTTVC